MHFIYDQMAPGRTLAPHILEDFKARRNQNESNLQPTSINLLWLVRPLDSRPLMQLQGRDNYLKWYEEIMKDMNRKGFLPIITGSYPRPANVPPTHHDLADYQHITDTYIQAAEADMWERNDIEARKEIIFSLSGFTKWHLNRHPVGEWSTAMSLLALMAKWYGPEAEARLIQYARQLKGLKVERDEDARQFALRIERLSDQHSMKLGGDGLQAFCYADVFTRGIGYGCQEWVNETLLATDPVHKWLTVPNPEATSDSRKTKWKHRCLLVERVQDWLMRQRETARKERAKRRAETLAIAATSTMIEMDDGNFVETIDETGVIVKTEVDISGYYVRHPSRPQQLCRSPKLPTRRVEYAGLRAWETTDDSMLYLRTPSTDTPPKALNTPQGKDTTRPQAPTTLTRPDSPPSSEILVVDLQILRSEGPTSEPISCLQPSTNSIHLQKSDVGRLTPPSSPISHETPRSPKRERASSKQVARRQQQPTSKESVLSDYEDLQISAATTIYSRQSSLSTLSSPSNPKSISPTQKKETRVIPAKYHYLLNADELETYRTIARRHLPLPPSSQSGATSTRTTDPKPQHKQSHSSRPHPPNEEKEEAKPKLSTQPPKRLARDTLPTPKSKKSKSSLKRPMPERRVGPARSLVVCDALEIRNKHDLDKYEYCPF